MFSRQYAIDGNNSLKRIAHVGAQDIADTRVFEDSNYYIPQAFVDKFANEMKAQKQPVDNNDAMDVDGDVPMVDERGVIQDTEGDPTDGTEPNAMIQICVKNWKSAASEEKKMWAIFAETGIFASACRHGLILWLIDMVRSREL